MKIGNAIEPGKSVFPMCLVPCVSSQSCNTSSPRNCDLLENPDKSRDWKPEKCTLRGQKLNLFDCFNVVKVTGSSSLILIFKKNVQISSLISIYNQWERPEGLKQSCSFCCAARKREEPLTAPGGIGRCLLLCLQWFTGLIFKSFQGEQLEAEFCFCKLNKEGFHNTKRELFVSSQNQML